MLKPGSRVGRFEIVAPLGVGGMGEVFRGRDAELGRDVAIKVLPAQYASDPARVERFAAEARATAALDHPNIVVVHEVGSHDGYPYMVAELLEGDTLREVMRGGALPTHRAIDIAVQIARGLEAAHARGIVHLDLKPTNVFVTRDGTVKLFDFGIAKLVELGATDPVGEDDTSPDTEAAVGTAGYMAPEQVRGLPAGPRADLFSLGCVVYEMLAGRQAFAGRTAAERLAGILHEDPPSLAGLQTRVPQGLARVVERCLEKRPEDRFSSAHDVAIALQAAGSSGARPAIRSTLGGRGWWMAGALAVVVGAVALWSTGAAEALWRRLRGSPAPEAIASLAVLPLENLSGDPLHDYVAEGMTEELIARLGRVGTLRVIARSSVMRFKGATTPLREIGEMLGVDGLVTGSVSTGGDRVRVTVQLVRASDEKTLWSQRLETPMRDVMALQSALAVELVEQIRAAVSPAERAALARAQPVVPEAYQAYLRGRVLCGQATREGFRLGREELDRAVVLDADFVEAQVALASCMFLYGYWGFEPPADHIGPARRIAERVLERDPANAEAAATLGIISLVYDWDWQLADARLTRAVDLDPNSSQARFYYALYLIVVRQYDDALAQARIAGENDPLSPWAVASLAFMSVYAGRPQEAVVALERATEVEPLSPTLWAFLAYARAEVGRPAEAELALSRARELASAGAQGQTDLWTVNALVALGRRGEADAVLALWLERESESYVDPQYVAAMAAAVGRNVLALDHLERAFDGRSPTLIRISADSVSYRGLRDEPRFRAFFRRMGYPPLGPGPTVR